MYSTRSNASQRKPFELYQFGLKPQFPLMDTERPDPPKTLGFGTLPSPKFQTPEGGIIPPGMTTPNNYRTDTPEVLKTRWNPDMEPDHQRLISLGYPVGGSRNVVIDSPEFPRQMERSLEAQWANADQYGARAGFNGSWLDRGSNSVNEGRTPIPQNMDLFDELGAGPMIKPLPMSVLTGQGEKPIQPIQLGTDARADVMVPDGQGAQNEVNFAPDVDPRMAMSYRNQGAKGSTLYTRQRFGGSSSMAPLEPGNINLGNRPIVRNADGSISTVRSMSFNDGRSEVLIPTVSDDGRIMSEEEAIQNYRATGKHLGKFSTPEEATRYAESLHNQQDQMYSPQARTLENVPPGYDKEAWIEQGLLVPIEEAQRQTEAIRRQWQGVPMGASPGSIQPMQSDPMPYKGGMSGPHFQGQMQSMLGDLLNRQNMGRQYNDMAMARDGYDDAWDRARANVFNPLMGGLMGGKQIAAMQSDSNNRMNQIMDRRQLRRQAMQDQWGQTKDLISMISANDPETLKNQFALQKIQNDSLQKMINQQNAGTQRFNAESNAGYKSRMATVAEQKARIAEGNLQRMITEGADRSQRGWAMIESNRSKWEASLEMRQAELEQRKQQAAASNDIRMMQLIQREEADLADEEFKYQKLSSELEAKAAEVDKFGAPKRSSEFVDKYGTKAAPGKEPAPQQNQAVDIINALGRFFQPAGSQQPSAPAAAAPRPVPGKTQAAKPAAAGGGKPLTANVVQMLKAKFPNDMKTAMAEARRLGYKVD